MSQDDPQTTTIDHDENHTPEQRPRHRGQNGGHRARGKIAKIGGFGKIGYSRPRLPCDPSVVFPQN